RPAAQPGRRRGDRAVRGVLGGDGVVRRGRPSRRPRGPRRRALGATIVTGFHRTRTPAPLNAPPPGPAPARGAPLRNRWTCRRSTGASAPDLPARHRPPL